MNTLFRLAAEVQDFCHLQNWRFCFIGGIAVLRWSEPRLTDDVDLTLLTGFGREEEFIDPLLERFDGRIEGARDFALQKRVLLLTSKDGIAIDIALAAFPFEQSAVKRASEYEFIPGVRLLTCSAEDLIVFKTFADRDLDWHDVKMTIARQGDSALEWPYIFRHLKPLCEIKGQPDILTRLKKLRASLRKLSSPTPRLKTKGRFK